MAERGKHRVAPAPALARKHYAYVPCPRSEEVGSDFALHLLKTHRRDESTPEKSPPVQACIVEFSNEIAIIQFDIEQHIDTLRLKT
ncbi:hypothetical protein RR48_03744 [Papilio machaon]|uniref:Uncharacterized protein n=1 Tax=Papilio machaon TaxID=76193 RepID=A0A0N0PB53_PAPMA|nr:hypothetical protein RR48_03744 [Papilio machaon]